MRLWPTTRTAAKAPWNRIGQQEPGNTSMQGQLGHRDQDPLLKSSDTDFPEPGGSPEHSGEPTEPKKRGAA